MILTFFYENPNLKTFCLESLLDLYNTRQITFKSSEAQKIVNGPLSESELKRIVMKLYTDVNLKFYSGRSSVQRILTKYLAVYIELQPRKHFNHTVF